MTNGLSHGAPNLASAFEAREAKSHDKGLLDIQLARQAEDLNKLIALANSTRSGFKIPLFRQDEIAPLYNIRAENGGEYILSSPLPVLSRMPDDLDTRFSTADILIIRGLILLNYAPVLYNKSDVNAHDQQILDAVSTTSSAINAAVSTRLERERSIILADCKTYVEQYLSEHKNDQSELRSLSKGMKDELAKLIQERERASDNIDHILQDIREGFHSSRTGIEEHVQEQIDIIHKESEATIAAFRTEKVLASPVALWSQKSHEHVVGYYVGILAFVSIIAGMIAYARVESDSIKAIIQALSGNSIGLATVVAFPVIVALLLLRVVSRHISTHLVLREDARQRKALADMLVRLTSETGVSIDAESRRIAFASLFRAAPGQPIDDSVGHPLMDIIKDTR